MKLAQRCAAIRLLLTDVDGVLTDGGVILDNAGGVPVEFHAHCNNGLAPFNLLEVVKQGIRIVHTSVPPLANGSAQPSIFNVVRNLRALGYTVLVNDKVLEPVEQHFRRVADEDVLHRVNGRPVRRSEAGRLTRSAADLQTGLRVTCVVGEIECQRTARGTDASVLHAQLVHAAAVGEDH